MSASSMSAIFRLLKFGTSQKLVNTFASDFPPFAACFPLDDDDDDDDDGAEPSEPQDAFSFFKNAWKPSPWYSAGAETCGCGV